jgi:hypothetical protein
LAIGYHSLWRFDLVGIVVGSTAFIDRAIELEVWVQPTLQNCYDFYYGI